MPNRRQFLKKSALAAASAWAAPLEKIAAEVPFFPPAAVGFSLKIMATDWGWDGSLDAFCQKIKALGYDGFETWYQADDQKWLDELRAALEKHGLEVGFLAGGWQAHPTEHFDHFARAAEQAAAFKPLYVNCHSGRDWFDFEANCRFIDLTLKLEKSLGTPIFHETHRGRMLFSAPSAKRFFEKFADLRVTADLSHWCVVHESLLEDQPEIVAETLRRTGHIHARVGHAQGPQVSDPRAPEWQKALETHLGWWDKIAERHRAEGRRLTILTEFGPPDYLPTLPYSRMPVADQWAINAHMLELLRKRYA